MYVISLASPCLMDLRGQRVTQNAYFSLLTHTKQLLLVKCCDRTAGIGDRFWHCLALWIPEGSEGDPECIFFTLDTYQETSVSDIL